MICWIKNLLTCTEWLSVYWRARIPLKRKLNVQNTNPHINPPYYTSIYCIFIVWYRGISLLMKKSFNELPHVLYSFDQFIHLYCNWVEVNDQTIIHSISADIKSGNGSRWGLNYHMKLGDWWVKTLYWRSIHVHAYEKITTQTSNKHYMYMYIGNFL